jgi:hypothetical protein
MYGVMLVLYCTSLSDELLLYVFHVRNVYGTLTCQTRFVLCCILRHSIDETVFDFDRSNVGETSIIWRAY